MTFLLYAFLALGILGFDIVLIHFLYKVLITGEKSDAPVWAVLVCFMFVALLTIIIVGAVMNYFRNFSNTTSATLQRRRRLQ